MVPSFSVGLRAKMKRKPLHQLVLTRFRTTPSWFEFLIESEAEERARECSRDGNHFVSEEVRRAV